MPGRSNNSYSLRKSPKSPPHPWAAQVTLAAEMSEETMASLPGEYPLAYQGRKWPRKLFYPNFSSIGKKFREIKPICLRLPSPQLVVLSQEPKTPNFQD